MNKLDAEVRAVRQGRRAVLPPTEQPLLRAHLVHHQRFSDDTVLCALQPCALIPLWPKVAGVSREKEGIMTQVRRRIAIVGFGPRGLGALEALVNRAQATGASMAVDVFDASRWPAAGPSFSPDESKVCLLNLPLRSIALPPPPSCSRLQEDFADWLGEAGCDREAYLPRAMLGTYLHERFKALLARLPDHISVVHHPLRVSAAHWDQDGWRLHAQSGGHGPFEHVLMSLGQPETHPDPQLKRWRKHAGLNALPLCPAYPGAELIRAAQDWSGRVVGIRGLALSSLDVIRMLTLGLGGRFEDGRYIASGREPARIVPFSLDGLAPWPKPLDAALDAGFDPLPREDAAFEAALHAVLSDSGNAGLPTAFDVLAASAVRVIRSAGGGAEQDEVLDWLEREARAPGSQELLGTLDALRCGIRQAEGQEPPAIGYTVGQLWRKWQPLLRSIYGSRLVPPATARAFTAFDEGLKRYSYGAPVVTARQLLMLIETGLVDPRAADDPGVALSSKGWDIQSGEAAVTADVMIDTVLPPPALERVAEPLVAGLQDAKTLTALSEGLGARCRPDAVLIRSDGTPVQGLGLAGRLSNGSSIAGDSIHDCFGGICDRWAETVLEAR